MVPESGLRERELVLLGDRVAVDALDAAAREHEKYAQQTHHRYRGNKAGAHRYLVKLQRYS